MLRVPFAISPFIEVKLFAAVAAGVTRAPVACFVLRKRKHLTGEMLLLRLLLLRQKIYWA